jgi:hypothetical protein
VEPVKQEKAEGQPEKVNYFSMKKELLSLVLILSALLMSFSAGGFIAFARESGDPTGLLWPLAVSNIVLSGIIYSTLSWLMR